MKRKSLDEIFGAPERKKTLDEIFGAPNNLEPPAPNLTEEQKTEIAQNIKNYEDKQADALVNNKLVRNAAALTQGMANASLNPAKYIAKAAGWNIRPLEPQSATERALEKAGEYGYDAGASAVLGAGAKGLGWLGQGQGKISKLAQNLLAPGAGEATASAAAGGIAEGMYNPKNTAENILANLSGGILGGGIYGLLKGPIKTRLMKSGLENIVQDNDALKLTRRAAKIDDDVATQISNLAPGAAENINKKTFDALEADLNGVPAAARYKNVRQAFQDFMKANKRTKIKRKTARVLGDTKEGVDYYINQYYKGLSQPAAYNDYLWDKGINQISRQRAKNGVYSDYKDACNVFRVNGINEKY